MEEKDDKFGDICLTGTQVNNKFDNKDVNIHKSKVWNIGEKKNEHCQIQSGCT